VFSIDNQLLLAKLQLEPRWRKWQAKQYCVQRFKRKQLINKQNVPFTGDHIQGSFNVSKTPRCTFSRSSNLSSSHFTANQEAVGVSGDIAATASASSLNIADCIEISKMQGMAVYFLHNKDRSRSYYNLDVRNANGTQKRVRSRDLPWGMKQVSRR